MTLLGYEKLGKRRPKTPVTLFCPRCKMSVSVQHLAWDAMMCPVCKADAARRDWLIVA